MGLKTNYDEVLTILKIAKSDRTSADLRILEAWFRLRSKYLKNLNTETLLDVIQHCEFVTREPDDVIIHQGEKGHRFYIILRGNVSILHKDSLEDVDLGEEGAPRFVERSTLGNELVRFGEGSTFGEIALINPDCIRTASVVANEKTDLVVIHRDLYNRSVSKVIAREYAEKINFIDSLPLFRDWAPKLKKYLVASLRKETYSFDCPIVKQGDPANEMFFVVSGEVKLQVDPEAHQEQFQRFISKYEDDSNSEGNNEKAYFPLKLLPQIEKLSRVSRAQNLFGGLGGHHEDPDDVSRGLPKSWSPSAIRHMNQQIRMKKVHLNLCYLGEHQYFGDLEFLLDLNIYHANVVCSRETIVMSLYKSHFERLFKRRHPSAIRNMAQTLELQLTRRILKPNIIDSVPLLKCFVYRLQEIIRDSGKKVQVAITETHSQTDIKGVTYEDTKHKSHEEKQKHYTWKDSFVDDIQPEPHKPKPLKFALRTPFIVVANGNRMVSDNGGFLTPQTTSAGKFRPEAMNKYASSLDNNNHITKESYRTHGAGFKSISGRPVAESFDRGMMRYNKTHGPVKSADIERRMSKKQTDFELQAGVVCAAVESSS